MDGVKTIGYKPARKASSNPSIWMQIQKGPHRAVRPSWYCGTYAAFAALFLSAQRFFIISEMRFFAAALK